jgi:hypothetical protein
MRKIPIIGAVFAALAFAPAANAADPITQVFTGTPTPIPCVTQDSGDYAGQRWCGDDDGKTTPTTTVPSFDRVPIDTNVILPPAPASGEVPRLQRLQGRAGGPVRPAVARAGLRRHVDHRPRLLGLLRGAGRPDQRAQDR